MRTRPLATGLLLGLAALILILATTASAYLYKRPPGQDCGKVTFTGGFGGPRPSNVPTDATPQIHTFIVRGHISCAKAKQVMTSFEKSFYTPTANPKGKSPAGWKCGYSKAVLGQQCTDVAKHVEVSNGIVYVVLKGR